MAVKWEAPQAHRTGPPSAEACKKNVKNVLLQSKYYSYNRASSKVEYDTKCCFVAPTTEIFTLKGGLVRPKCHYFFVFILFS